MDGTAINDWVSTLLNSDYGPTFPRSTSAIFLVIISALAVGHVIGFVYILTHEGISYSRTFVASIAVLPVLVGTLMVVMAGSLVIAFALAAIGMLHFRNMMKDTRDTVFIFWAYTEGMTVGMTRFSTAMLAALGIGAMFLYLRVTAFGSRNRYDAVLRLHITGDLATTGPNLRQILSCYARPRLIHQRSTPDGSMDRTYRLLLRDPSRVDELETQLSRTEGLTNVAVFMRKEEAEV